MTIRCGFGWRPDLPDYRDQPYRFSNALAGEMKTVGALPPQAYPQRKEVLGHPIRDQGQAGSCVGHGVGFIAAIERNVSQRSPLFIYAEARKMIDELDQDNGAYIRDGAKVVGTLGAPVESKWPYHMDRLFLDPGDSADRDAAKRKVFSYHRLQTPLEYRSCLASGHLFTIGFTVYSSMTDPMADRLGIIELPQGGMEGGHCVAITGYHDDFRNSEWAAWARNLGAAPDRIPERVYELRNSWGRSWGRNGSAVIDARYLEDPNLADDAWTLRGFADENR
jgi:C1A family cysteine protease